MEPNNISFKCSNLLWPCDHTGFIRCSFIYVNNYLSKVVTHCQVVENPLGLCLSCPFGINGITNVDNPFINNCMIHPLCGFAMRREVQGKAFNFPVHQSSYPMFLPCRRHCPHVSCRVLKLRQLDKDMKQSCCSFMLGLWGGLGISLGCFPSALFWKFSR